MAAVFSNDKSNECLGEVYRPRNASNAQLLELICGKKCINLNYFLLEAVAHLLMGMSLDFPSKKGGSISPR